MMRYFRFQLHQLLTNRKNLAVIGIALVDLPVRLFPAKSGAT